MVERLISVSIEYGDLYKNLGGNRGTGRQKPVKTVRAKDIS